MLWKFRIELQSLNFWIVGCVACLQFCCTSWWFKKKKKSRFYFIWNCDWICFMYLFVLFFGGVYLMKCPVAGSLPHTYKRVHCWSRDLSFSHFKTNINRSKQERPFNLSVRTWRHHKTTSLWWWWWGWGESFKKRRAEHKLTRRRRRRRNNADLVGVLYFFLGGGSTLHRLHARRRQNDQGNFVNFVTWFVW